MAMKVPRTGICSLHYLFLISPVHGVAEHYTDVSKSRQSQNSTHRCLPSVKILNTRVSNLEIRIWAWTYRRHSCESLSVNGRRVSLSDEEWPVDIQTAWNILRSVVVASFTQSSTARETESRTLKTTHDVTVRISRRFRFPKLVQ